MIEVLWSVAMGTNYFVLIYFLALNAVYLWTTLLAFFSLRRISMRLKAVDSSELVGSEWAPPITLIAPAYNEEATSIESVRSLLTLEYPDVEVVVVNDGSKDDTLGRLQEAFNLYRTERVPTGGIATADVRAIYRSRRQPNLWVIDKENGGKADALNVGINYSHTPYVLSLIHI